MFRGESGPHSSEEVENKPPVVPKPDDSSPQDPLRGEPGPHISTAPQKPAAAEKTASEKSRAANSGD